MTAQLNVTLHGRKVATIANTPGDTNVVSIDRDFASDPQSPILSFRAFRDPITTAYRSTIRPTQTVVHPYFSNLLPEGPLRKYIAHHARLKPIRDFPLLRLLGHDLPGALVIRDDEGALESPLDHAFEEHEANIASSSRNTMRFSLAGVQLKFSASGNPQRGLTIPVGGLGGRWILKLPDQRFAGVPENEYSMMTFARNVGIDVPTIGLVPAAEIEGLPSDIRFSGNAYYIERFDRGLVGERVHMEDFAQANMLFPAEKYERFNFDMLLTQVADLMGSNVAMSLLQRIIFNVGIGNGDMHAKNWTVVYLDDRTPSLAPAYDYVSTINYLPNENLGMNLAGTKAYADIDMECIERLASHARLSAKAAGRVARDMVSRMRATWLAISDTLPIDDAHKLAITRHMESVPLFQAPTAADARNRTRSF